MRIVTVSEALQYGEKEKIPALRGRLSRINQFKTGTSARGGWTLQLCDLQDEQDPKAVVKLKIWGLETGFPRGWNGKTLYVESAPSERGGSKGVTSAVDDHGPHVEVKIEDGAWVGLDDQSQNEAPPQRQTPASAPQDHRPAQGSRRQPDAPERQPAQQEAQNSQPSRQTQSRQPKTAEELAAEETERKHKAIRNAARWTGQKLNGYRLFMRAIESLNDERKEAGKPMIPEAQMQAMVSSLMIDAGRVNLFGDFPHSKEEFEKLFPSK